MPLSAKQFQLQFWLFVCALSVYVAVVGFTLIIRGVQSRASLLAGRPRNTLEQESNDYRTFKQIHPLPRFMTPAQA